MRAYKDDRCSNGFLPRLAGGGKYIFEQYILAEGELPTILFLTYWGSQTTAAMNTRLRVILDLTYHQDIALPHESIQ